MTGIKIKHITRSDGKTINVNEDGNLGHVRLDHGRALEIRSLNAHGSNGTWAVIERGTGFVWEANTENEYQSEDNHIGELKPIHSELFVARQRLAISDYPHTGRPEAQPQPANIQPRRKHTLADRKLRPNQHTTPTM